MKPTSTAIVLIPNPTGGSTSEESFVGLKEMVLASVQSEHSQRSTQKHWIRWSLCRGRQEELSRSLLMACRASLLDCNLSPSTINVRLSAMRKLASEAVF
jgi:hypothetical protein